MKYQPDAALIIATDFRDIAIFSPPTPHRSPTYERVASTQPALALRILSAAYLVDKLPYDYLIRADVDIEADTDLILPEGPPQDPSQPLEPDEVMFATHRRNSDFDIATLIRDSRRAAQFFRWHVHVQSEYSKLVAHQGDVLYAVTNEVGHPCLTMDMCPICPFDISELPADTAQLIHTVQRESPLDAAGVASALAQSKSFTIRILEVIAEGSKLGLCTVYRCQITAIDGKPVTSPPLCLKLFDDRFLPLHPPAEGEVAVSQDAEAGPRWFDRLILAEGYAVNEASAYDKLRPVQGGIVPWFYGVHQVSVGLDGGVASLSHILLEFTLPNGIVLCGLLMEYIDGWQLDSQCMRSMSAERQISVVRRLNSFPCISYLKPET